MGKLHTFFEKVGEGAPIAEACKMAGLEGTEKGPYGKMLVEAAVLYRADQTLGKYEDDTIRSMLEWILLSPGEQKKSPELSTRMLKYIGGMVRGMDVVRRYEGTLREMEPEDAFEHVFGLPAENVGVDYSGWALGFYLGEGEFEMLRMNEGIGTEDVSGMILESAPVEGELRGKTVAVKWGEYQHKRMEHEKQHLRLFSLGRDYRPGISQARKGNSVDMFVKAYKAKLVDELICCLESGMPLDQTLDSMNTEFSRMQDFLRRGVIPGKDVFKHISAGPLDDEDLRIGNRGIVNLIVQTGSTLPNEYLVPLLLGTDYDNIQMELIKSNDVFK